MSLVAIACSEHIQKWTIRVQQTNQRILQQTITAAIPNHESNRSDQTPHALPDERNRYTTQKRHKAAHGSHQSCTPISHHAITSSPTHRLPSKLPIAQTSTATYLPSRTHTIYYLHETHTRPTKLFPPSPCGSPRNPVPAATLLLLLPRSSYPRPRAGIRIRGVRFFFPVHLIGWREVGRGWLFC